MLHSIPLMLQTDSVEYLDMCCRAMKEKTGREYSRSDFITRLLVKDEIARIKRAEEKRSDKRAIARIRGKGVV